MIAVANKNGGAKAWALVLVLAAAAIGYFAVYPKLASSGRFAAVRTEAGDLAAKCRARGPANREIRFPPDVLIWDLDADKESDAQGHLPESMRAGSQDDLGTLVLILNVRKEETTEYMPLEGTSMGGPTEVRYIYTVGAIAWSNREAAGLYEVIVDPPGMRGNQKDDRPGNWFDRGLADWVRARALAQ